MPAAAAADFAAAMPHVANVEVARFVNACAPSVWATLLLVLVSAPDGRVRCLVAPFEEGEKAAAVAADVHHRDAVAIGRAIRHFARALKADVRQTINFLAVALDLAPAGGPPFLGLGDVPRSRGGADVVSEWGPCWPPNLPAAVAAMEDRLNDFVSTHLNADA